MRDGGSDQGFRRLHSCAFTVLDLRWVFVCGFQHSFFITIFCLREIPCVQRFGLLSKHHIISTNVVSNDAACDAVQTNSKSMSFVLGTFESFSDWIGMNRPSALVEPSLPSHGWADGRGCPQPSPDSFSYDSNSFATACLPLRTLTGKLFSCRGACE
jgi:hypothetical protein